MTFEEAQKALEELFGQGRDYFDLNILHEIEKKLGDKSYLYIELLAGEGDYYTGYSISDIEEAVLSSAGKKTAALLVCYEKISHAEYQQLCWEETLRIREEAKKTKD